MKIYNINLLFRGETICIKNLCLAEIGPINLGVNSKGIEVNLKFKAPSYDKKGERNALIKKPNEKLKVTKEIILK